MRVGVGHARHGVVVRLPWVAEEVRGDHAPLVLADVGERPDAGDVADRPEPLGGAKVRVDRDAAWVRLDADGLEANAVDPRSPAGGDEQPVAAQLAAVVELEDVVLTVAAGGGPMDAEVQLDAVAAEDLGERVSQRRRLAREEATTDERHLASEAP